MIRPNCLSVHTIVPAAQTYSKGATQVSPIYSGPVFRLTCFDEADSELREVKVRRDVSWTDMQAIISDTLGRPAMLAYDNGVGVDLPVQSAAVRTPLLLALHFSLLLRLKAFSKFLRAFVLREMSALLCA